MANRNMIISLLSSFIILFFIPTLSFATSNETDLQALLDFKNHIASDPSRFLNSWNDSVHFCDWQGITCGKRHKRVTVLNVSSLDLVGTLSPSVGNLTFLKEIYLSNNSFQGIIPPEIGRLFRLEYLSLSENSFEGQLPANIALCKNLQFIQLNGNNLSGRIPDQLGALSNLIALGLEYAVGAPASTLVDVYNYGVLLLEMFSGKRPTDVMFKDAFSLHNYVKMAIPTQVMRIVDPRLFAECANNPFRISGEAIRRNACELEKGLASVFRVGVICSAQSPKERMEIADALVMLETVRDALSKLLY